MTFQTSLLEALPVAVYMTDAEGRVTFFNQAAADLWGRVPAMGTPWCGSWKLFHPDGRPMQREDCPLAVALAEGRPVRGVEALLERPNGTRVPILPHPTPIRDDSGRITGAVNVLVDLSERDKARVESSLLAAIVASSNDAIVSKTIDGRITSWNTGAERIFGYTAEEMIGEHITKIIPWELRGEEERIIAQLRRGERVDHFDTIRVAKDGRRIDISLTISPLRNARGEVVGASKVARDITDRKRAERSQRLLVDELNHRVKNTLATVQAIATVSSRQAGTLRTFVPSFTGRIQALAKAHTLLARARMEGAEIADLVREQVCLGEMGDTRIQVTGPRLMLDAQSAVHLSMVLHELATNARRHGALSVPEGRLAIAWEVRADAERSLVLHWEEQGSPPARTLGARGFGTTLIEQTLRGRGGHATMTYEATGMSGEIVLPLPEGAPPVEAEALGTGRRERVSEAGVPEPPPGLSGKRIIVIEDEPLISLDLELMLAAAGCKVVGSAGTSEQGMLLVEDTECDAALLDGNLAGEPVDGIARALTRRGIPFAFITGYGRESLPPDFRDAVVVGKPFSGEQLSAALLSLLDPSTVPILRRADNTA